MAVAKARCEPGAGPASSSARSSTGARESTIRWPDSFLPTPMGSWVRGCGWCISSVIWSKSGLRPPARPCDSTSCSTRRDKPKQPVRRRRFGGDGCYARQHHLLDAEPEAGSRPDLLHADLLKLDALETGVPERPEAGAQQHWHDIDTKLVYQTSLQKLLDHAYATDHHNCLVPGGGGCLRDCRLDAIGHEREGQVLVLLR